MTDTLQNVTLPNDTWVDLYAATGIDTVYSGSADYGPESAARWAN